MKGQIKVLGSNLFLKHFEDFEGEGSLTSLDKSHHSLMLGENKLFYQITTVIHAKNHMEYEGWCSDEDSNAGRMGIKFTPKNAS